MLTMVGTRRDKQEERNAREVIVLVIKFCVCSSYRDETVLLLCSLLQISTLLFFAVRMFGSVMCVMVLSTVDSVICL